MAIYSAVPPPAQFGVGATGPARGQGQHISASGGSPGAADIESWAASALASLAVSDVANGPGKPLAITLDPDGVAGEVSVNMEDPRRQRDPATPLRRPLSRRDSMKRRDALLKGNEGSRQRRRWENDRLVGVPHAQPPEPCDWQPRPTHPVQHVPYQVAAVWDLRVRAEVEAGAALRRQQQQQQQPTRVTLGDGRVPRELCHRARRTPVVRAWVRSVEEPMRRFLVARDVACVGPGAETDDDDDGGADYTDDDDDEIVFVGRNGSMTDGRRRRATRESGAHEERDGGMVFDARLEHESSAFKRWLTHSVSRYYGLESRSVLVGDPSRKAVYVAIDQMRTGHGVSVPALLPRPLWELC